MITLYTFGPAWGLPDPSPFVTKADVLLKLSNLPYRTQTGSLRRAPKGKLPYIDDDGTLVADSTFIRLHLEQRHGIDFDRHLTPAQRAVAWATEKLCEDHLYWLAVHERWLDDANFARGPAVLFNVVPAPVRGLVRVVVRRQIRRALRVQGLGRHNAAERDLLAERALAALSEILGDRPYLMGGAPCAADATVFAFALGTLCPHFTGPIRARAERHANLVAYAQRLTKQYYPDVAPAA